MSDELKLDKPTVLPTNQELIVRQNAMTRAVDLFNGSGGKIDWNNKEEISKIVATLMLIAQTIEEKYYWKPK